MHLNGFKAYSKILYHNMTRKKLLNILTRKKLLLFLTIKKLSMENIVGQIASKENFYMREREIKRINRHLKAGANLQLAAPRRVGKSSILVYYLDRPEPGFIHLYLQVESARTKNEYYRKIYKEIIKSEAVGTGKKFFEQMKNAGNAFLNRLKGVKVAGTGVDFQDTEEYDYEEELLNLLLGLDLGNDRLVLMVDEFPEVILNIVEDHKGETTEARKFLQSNRELRNNANLRNKIQFIYTGSNSLNLTVSNLDSSSLINDLTAIPVTPLTETEAKDLIESVLSTYEISITEPMMEYMIAKVEWTIPFYFQLIIQELIDEMAPGDAVTEALTDQAFVAALESRNDHHFEHYVKRLKRVFTPAEQKFIGIFLCQLAGSDTMDKDDIVNLATGILTSEETGRLLDALKYDGYIIDKAAGAYKFNSPILRNWWKKHEC